MNKKKEFGIGNILLVSVITALGVVASIIVSSVLYYFTKCLSAAEVGNFYNVMVRFIEISSTLCALILLAETMHGMLYKTVISREFEKDQNPKFVKFAYWFILGVVAVIIMFVFKMLLPVFNVYSLLLVLVVLKITQLMAKYTFIKYDISKEDKALLYLVFAIVMVSICMFEYFAIENTIKPAYENRINECKEFYTITEQLKANLDANDIQGAKRYIAYANVKTDNKLVKEYAEIFEQIDDNVTDAQMNNLKESMASVVNTAKHNCMFLEDNLSEASFTRALLVEIIIVLVVSTISFIVYSEGENNSAKTEKKAQKKAVKKVEEKVAEKKVATKKTATTKKTTAKKTTTKKTTK